MIFFCQGWVQVSCGEVPDSDVSLILLHYAHSVLFTIQLDAGFGKHRQIVNVSELLFYDARSVRIHRKDVTSAFKGKGKEGPLKKLQNYPSTMLRLGESVLYMTSSA